MPRNNRSDLKFDSSISNFFSKYRNVRYSRSYDSRLAVVLPPWVFREITRLGSQNGSIREDLKLLAGNNSIDWTWSNKIEPVGCNNDYSSASSSTLPVPNSFDLANVEETRSIITTDTGPNSTTHIQNLFLGISNLVTDHDSDLAVDPKLMPKSTSLVRDRVGVWWSATENSVSFNIKPSIGNAVAKVLKQTTNLFQLSLRIQTLIQLFYPSKCLKTWLR